MIIYPRFSGFEEWNQPFYYTGFSALQLLGKTELFGEF